MFESTDEVKEALNRLVPELPFDPDEDSRAEIATTVSEMLSLADDFTEPPVEAESVGHFVEDEYNTLLEVYEQPRPATDEGSLSGLSFAVKDNIMAEGLTTSCGSEQLSYVPSYDATVVERLLAAGAEMVGKNNMEPFAIGPTGDHSDFGRVENPGWEGRISGGSSSGSGASVAAGLVDISLGTDTGGSVRIPAACCGVIGVKPTHGLVPRHGFVDFAPSTDTIGPIALDVETAGRALEAIAGYDPRDPFSGRRVTEPVLGDAFSDPSGTTVGVLTPLTEPADEAVSEALYGAADRLDDRTDLSVRELNEDIVDPDLVRLYPFLATEFVWMIRQRGVLRGQSTGFNEGWRRALKEFAESETFSDYIATRILPGEVVDELTDGAGYTAVRNTIASFEAELQCLFEKADVLLAPTLRILPPRYDELDEIDPVYDIGGNTAPFSFTGNPAVSVPIDLETEAPVSAQVVASPYEDGLALGVADRLESIAEGERPFTP